MPKSLKELFEVYRPKAKDEADFVDKHVTIKHPDRNGNGDDVFKGNTKKADRKKERHGYEPGEDEKVYEETEIPLSHRNKREVSHYRVLNNGRDVTRHDTYEDAKEYAQKHRAKLKKDGYRSDQVTVHAYVKEEVEHLEEGTMKLSKVHIVHHHDHPAAKEFAKNYTEGMKRDHREGGPTEKDEKASDKFHSRYSTAYVKHGFAGSGTTIYHDHKTGAKWRVDRHPNGKTFYGTDHIISHHVGDIHESVESDYSFTEDEDKVIRSLAGAAEELGEELDLETLAGIAEEVLSELSTDTLRSYRAKAKDDAYDAHDVDDDRRLRKRSAGSYAAGKKILKRGDTLRTEEVEDLDEISKATMGSYLNKAEKDLKNNKSKQTYFSTRGYSTSQEDKNISKRSRGIEAVTKKLTKEDIINKAIETYIPEDVELPSLQERLVDKLDEYNLSEAHIHILLSMFDSLNEQNQQRMLDRVNTLEDVNSLLDFAISNRGE